MGTEVTIVEMMDSLVPREDGDVAAAFTEIAAERHDVYTGHRVTAVEEGDGGHVVHAETEDGETLTVEGSEVFVALGRRPTSDGLGLETAGIAVDDLTVVRLLTHRPPQGWRDDTSIDARRRHRFRQVRLIDRAS